MKEMLPDDLGKGNLDDLIRGQMDRIGLLAEARKTCKPTKCEIIT